eukprot:765988-Hanusia_phi.AAC.26
MLLADVENFLENEIAATSRAAALYPKNYYAWTHRYWVTTRLKSVLTSEAKAEEVRRLNVSDTAAHSFRTSLLRFRVVRLLEDQNRRAEEMIDMLRIELQHSITTIEQHPSHESVWIALQGLLHVCLDCLPEKRMDVVVTPAVFLPLIESCNLMEELRAWELLLQDSRPCVSSEGFNENGTWQDQELLLAWSLQFARLHVQVKDLTAACNTHALRFAAKMLCKFTRQDLSPPADTPLYMPVLFQIKAALLGLLISICPMQAHAWLSLKT